MTENKGKSNPKNGNPQRITGGLLLPYITKKEAEILNLLKSTNNITSLSALNKRRKQNTFKTLNKLIFKGLVDKRGSLYYLNSVGLSLTAEADLPLSNPPYDGFVDRITPSLNKKGIFREKIRLHDLSFTVRFWHIPEGWDRLGCVVLGLPGLECVKVNPKFRGGFVSFGFSGLSGFRVAAFKSSVRVWLPEVVRDTPEEATGEALNVLFEFLPRLERLLKIPDTALFKLGRLNIKPSSRHYALFESAFARFMVLDRGKTRFVVPGDCGEVRLLVDRSLVDGRRHYEYEAVDAVKGEDDIIVIRDVEKDYIEGRGLLPGEVKERIENISGLLDTTNTVMADFARNIEAHTHTAKANLEAAFVLNRALDRLDKFMAPFYRIWLFFKGFFP